MGRLKGSKNKISKLIVIVCEVCHKKSKQKPAKFKMAKNHFCSLDCYHKYKLGKSNTWFKGKKLSEIHRCKISMAHKGKKLSEIHKINIGLGNIGRIFTKETRLKIGKANSNENGGMWKGDDVGYQGLHTWVRKHLGRPNTCEFCGKTGLSGKFIQWANKSHKYLRDKTDWLRLCGSCHKFYDKHVI
jgi:hypothetical protein